jgi:hypothetical protein
MNSSPSRSATEVRVFRELNARYTSAENPMELVQHMSRCNQLEWGFREDGRQCIAQTDDTSPARSSAYRLILLFLEDDSQEVT